MSSLTFKVRHVPPPMFDVIISRFRVPLEAVFTWGDTIYAPGPSTERLPDDLVVHEQVHMEQQGLDPAGWWTRYLDDKAFRLEQELMAYRRQYRWLCQRKLNKSVRRAELYRLAADLASPIYGSMIRFDAAVRAIRG